MLMKRFTLLLVLLLTFFLLEAQDDQATQTGKPIVSKAVYHDKTPPLRDMKIILPGERDRKWKDHIIQNKSVEDSIKNQKYPVPDGFVDPVLQKNYTNSRGTRGPVINLAGVGNVNGVYPPDTEGDVSPDYYFQMINLSFAIWDKDGNQLYGPVDNSTLWTGFIGPWTGTNDGDPVVVYDELAGRWMATQFAVNTSNGTYWELVAISETSDPLGSYYRYAFQFPAFNDYPKLSVWTDAYYATFNMFGGNTRVGVAAFQRDSMLVGNSANMVYFNQPSGTFSMLPADFDGTPPPDGTPCYFGHLRTFSTQKFEIYAFHVDWNITANSTFTLEKSLSPASFNPNIDGIPQPGTGQQLDALNMMLMYRLQYRNFGSYQTLVTNHTVNAGGRAGVRWYEFRKDTADWYIYQQGTFSPDNENRWMGSIAMGGNGNIALGYSVSSSSTFPSLYYTGRSPSAAPGEMNFSEIKIIGGTSSQSGINRWGDYSAMSVDPTDDTTFWYTSEYHRSSWKTRIISFNFGPIQPPSVNAGNDTTICETEPFQAQAEAVYQQSVQWQTGGDGFFVDPTKIDATYLRGAGDVTNGQVSLKITAFGYNEGQQVADSLILSFAQMATANAGPDTTICADESIQLLGSAVNYDSILWKSEGDGTFNVDTVFNPIYTPGAADIQKGWVRLSLTAYDTIPCTAFQTDKMKLTIDQCTGIDEKNLPSLSLKVVPNPNAGVFDFSISGLNLQEQYVVTFLNAQGQELFMYRLKNNAGQYSNHFDLSYYPRGTYFLKVTGNKNSVVQRVILK
jgi:hypothetical protein